MVARSGSRRAPRLAQVRQEAPSGPQSLLETVLATDTERLALIAEQEHADPLRQAEIHERLRAIGADSAPSRAATILAGLGFDAGRRPARWTASPAAGACGSRWPRRCSPTPTCCCSTSRPTTSTSRRRCGSRAGSPRFPGAALIVSHDRGLLDRAVRGDRPSRPRQDQPDAGRLRRVRAHPHRAGPAAGAHGRADRGAARAHAGLRRPVPLQGEQGAAGAVAAEGAGEAAALGRGRRGRADPVRLPGAQAAGAADPDAGARRRRV